MVRDGLRETTDLLTVDNVLSCFLNLSERVEPLPIHRYLLDRAWRHMNSKSKIFQLLNEFLTID
jgi:hypothetical protein